MREVAVQASTPEKLVSAVIMQLNEGKIEDAIASFDDEFMLKDHGTGLEFTDKGRLTEFFQKARELYPEYVQRLDRTLVSGEYVITQWTLQVTITEPFYGDSPRGSRFRSPEFRSSVSETARLPTGPITTTVGLHGAQPWRTLYEMDRILSWEDGHDDAPATGIGLGIVEFAFVETLYDFDSIRLNSLPTQSGDASDPQ